MADLVERLREVCLALPEASEKEAWGHPTFRVRDRMFAMASTREGIAVWLNVPEGTQEHLVSADPERFFRPPYVGPKGWVGMRLEGADWDEVAELARRAYLKTAPKRLAAQLAP